MLEEILIWNLVKHRSDDGFYHITDMFFQIWFQFCIYISPIFINDLINSVINSRIPRFALELYREIAEFEMRSHIFDFDIFLSVPFDDIKIEKLTNLDICCLRKRFAI